MNQTRLIVLTMMMFVLFFVAGCHKNEVNAKQAIFRANPQHTGVYDARGVPELTKLKWSFKTGEAVFSSPAVAEGVVYLGSLDNMFTRYSDPCPAL